MIPENQPNEENLNDKSIIINMVDDDDEIKILPAKSVEQVHQNNILSTPLELPNSDVVNLLAEKNKKDAQSNEKKAEVKSNLANVIEVENAVQKQPVQEHKPESVIQTPVAEVPQTIQKPQQMSVETSKPISVASKPTTASSKPVPVASKLAPTRPKPTSRPVDDDSYEYWEMI